MSDRRRFRRDSGRLGRGPITDFWQISATVQDPEVPNLPLETGGTPPAAPDLILGASEAVDEPEDDAIEFVAPLTPEAALPEPDLIFAAIAEAFDDSEDQPGFFGETIAAMLADLSAPVQAEDDSFEDEAPSPGFTVNADDIQPPASVADDAEDDEPAPAWLAQIFESVAAADEFIAVAFSEVDEDFDDEAGPPVAFLAPEDAPTTTARPPQQQGEPPGVGRRDRTDLSRVSFDESTVPAELRIAIDEVERAESEVHIAPPDPTQDRIEQQESTADEVAGLIRIAESAARSVEKLQRDRKAKEAQQQRQADLDAILYIIAADDDD